VDAAVFFSGDLDAGFVLTVTWAFLRVVVSRLTLACTTSSGRVLFQKVSRTGPGVILYASNGHFANAVDIV